MSNSLTKCAGQTKRSTDKTWLEQHSRATQAFGSSNNTEYFLSGEVTTLNLIVDGATSTVAVLYKNGPAA